MDRIARKSLQGVVNILRFNWHFYVIAVLVTVSLFFFNSRLAPPYNICIHVIAWGIVVVTALSLLASMYIYDLTGFYTMKWISHRGEAITHVLNIHAGFDETSEALQHLYPHAQLVVYDFFDPVKHTEVSIRRAREAYLPYAGTIPVVSTALPPLAQQADLIFLIFAAHEIRNDQERVNFLRSVKKLLRPGGVIYLVEHLRDLPNLLVYNIGAFHFFARKQWVDDMQQAGFFLLEEKKHTPFVRIFIYQHNGTTH